MSTADLKAIQAGKAVTLLCQTSEKDIFYHHLPDNTGREPFTPSSDSYLRAIAYKQYGIVIGVEESAGPVAYFVLQAVAEASIIPVNKVMGTEVRQKTLHVPVGAIKQVI